MTVANFPHYDIHPLAAIIPEMTPEMFSELVADIKANGLLDPITIHDAMVLDGRHRYRACKELGIAPHFEPLPPDADPLLFVISKNTKRRDLTESQRAACAVEIKRLLEERAKQRKKRNKAIEIESAQMQTEPSPEPSAQMQTPASAPEPQGEAAELAAKAAGVSKRYVYEADKLSKEDPEAFKEVKAGKTTLTKVRKRKESSSKPAAPPKTQKQEQTYDCNSPAFEHISSEMIVDEMIWRLDGWDDSRPSANVKLGELAGKIIAVYWDTLPPMRRDGIRSNIMTAMSRSRYPSAAQQQQLLDLLLKDVATVYYGCNREQQDCMLNSLGLVRKQVNE